ncbi:GNAT family N-acetyltransferase [Croceivirga radicis]|uniref:GNAT family N-acetyltransferase n=1 Tax=Croceivirga radicis TaxID=1929488 RepID=A0A1V6LVS3_9FLAO|nr:GNAT family N-acetyltransferase [Croceivirga radicis]OQD44280.1 GNAT family N-acetyltransferase [Croceivirga radicis]
MKVQVKKFNELTVKELYAILALRSEVFVVEQNCVYQDIDFKDQKAYHLILKEEGNIAAYTRIFKAGDYFEDNASIGRVVVSPKYRGLNFGKKVMEESLKFIRKKIETKGIEISAQVYLLRFYNNLGFKEVGEPYLEDDIPHIRMLNTN